MGTSGTSDAADDLFKVNGRWLSPPRVESALIAHPAIVNAVIARDDESKLTKPAAYVVLNPDFSPSNELVRELQDWVVQRIGRVQAPTVDRVVSELPKNYHGQIAAIQIARASGPEGFQSRLPADRFERSPQGELQGVMAMTRRGLPEPPHDFQRRSNNDCTGRWKLIKVGETGQSKLAAAVHEIVVGEGGSRWRPDRHRSRPSPRRRLARPAPGQAGQSFPSPIPEYGVHSLLG